MGPRDPNLTQILVCSSQAWDGYPPMQYIINYTHQHHLLTASVCLVNVELCWLNGLIILKGTKDAQLPLLMMKVIL